MTYSGCRPDIVISIHFQRYSLQLTGTVGESGTCTCELRIVRPKHSMFTAFASSSQVRLSSITNTQGSPPDRPGGSQGQNHRAHRPVLETRQSQSRNRRGHRQKAARQTQDRKRPGLEASAGTDHERSRINHCLGLGSLSVLVVGVRVKISPGRSLPETKPFQAPRSPGYREGGFYLPYPPTRA